MPPRQVPRWISDRQPRSPPGPTSGSTDRHGLGAAAAARQAATAHARTAGRARSRVREVLRWLVRNSVLYPLTGVWVLTRRWWEARTNARYERLMRAAEAAGDHDRLTEWEARAEQAREQRHRRRMDWITAPLELARTAAVLILWLVGALLGLGAVLAIAHPDLSWLLAPLAQPWCRWWRGWSGCSRRSGGRC